MVKPSVLIVEDEADIRELVSWNLLKEGFQVASVATGEEALATAGTKTFDLVLLDLMLPGMDGLTVCRRLKTGEKTASIPVIMLTAKRDEVDIVAGLNLGADDYVTKPFSPKVLLARIDAVLRRASNGKPTPSTTQVDDETISIHDLVIHPHRHQVILQGEPIQLSATEFRVLHFLVSKPGWVFTRQQILDGVHGSNYIITDRSVDVLIVGLRKKLGPASRYIETVRGVGYRFLE